MHIVIFGANGPTGHLLMDEAVTAGHQVTAVTRRPDSIPLRDALTVVGAAVVPGYRPSDSFSKARRRAVGL